MKKYFMTLVDGCLNNFWLFEDDALQIGSSNIKGSYDWIEDASDFMEFLQDNEDQKIIEEIEKYYDDIGLGFDDLKVVRLWFGDERKEEDYIKNKNEGTHSAKGECKMIKDINEAKKICIENNLHINTEDKHGDINSLALERCSVTDKQRAENFNLLFEKGYVIEDIKRFEEEEWTNIFDSLKYSELAYNIDMIRKGIIQVKKERKSQQSSYVNMASILGGDIVMEFERETNERFVGVYKQLTNINDKLIKKGDSIDILVGAIERLERKIKVLESTQLNEEE